MKALSLTQPWASLVAAGYKTWETRSWRTDYTGELVIHAAKTFPGWARELCRQEPFRFWLDLAGYEGWDELPLGNMVGVVDLLECRPAGLVGDKLRHAGNVDELALGDYSAGRWAWRLGGSWKLEVPVACRGSLGLWDVPDDVVARINDARRTVAMHR